MHVGTADVQTTVALAKHADGLGVDAVAAVPPFYYTDHTPWEITAHFKTIAAAVKSPLFLYDNESTPDINSARRRSRSSRKKCRRFAV